MTGSRRRARPVKYIMLRSLAVLGIFLGSQVVCTTVIMLFTADWGEIFRSIGDASTIEAIDNANSVLENSLRDMMPAMAWGMAISSIITALVIFGTRLTPSAPGKASWRGVSWGLMLTIPAALIANVIIELGNVGMSEELANTFEELATDPVGILAICVLGPIAEEAVFRRGMLGLALSQFGNRRSAAVAAIVITGCVFGAVHGNASQFVGAGVLGVLFGWVYYRTGSIVPCVVMHIFNNSAAIGLGYLFPDQTFIGLLGGTYAAIYLCVVSAVAIVIMLRKAKWSELDWLYQP